MSILSRDPAASDLPRVATDAAAGDLLASLLLGRDTLAEEPGDEVGLYRLIEKLGDGGFGTVWRAEQSEPVQREVALKIIKLGMDTLEVMARFEQERRALARMDHPNIAKVFDAGMTPEGRAFFVMELVHGVPITEYCLTAHVPLRQRLRLFNQVCHAVQHAHLKGIIHRDLKPSNILVAEVEGLPVPKVIDFGIAKAVSGGSLAEYALITRQEQLLGTPLYMSPEQVSGGSMDTDAQSDVYSLGALLYELLTGVPPFDTKTLLCAGQEEMRRIIREVEPVLPSRRVTADTKGVKGQKKPKAQTTLESLPSFQPLPKDLDHITLKALEKDRQRRYVSPTALAEDIQRYLANEPVSAHPPGTGYLMRRWIRRHRAAFTAGCVSLLAILAGAGVAIREAVRATDSEATAVAKAAEAERQLKAADEATALVTNLLRSFSVDYMGRQLSQEELYAEMLKKVLAFEGDPLRKARVLMTLSDARGNGSIGGANVEALKLIEPIIDPNDPFLWEVRLAVAMGRMLEPNTCAEGMALLRQVYEWRRKHTGPESAGTVYAMLLLGRQLNDMKQYDESLPLLDLASKAIVRSTAKQLNVMARAHILMEYGYALFYTGRQDEGMASCRESLKTMRDEGAAQYSHLATLLQKYGNLCWKAGLPDEAFQMMRQSVETNWKAYGFETTNTQWVLSDLSLMFRERKDLEGVPALYHELAYELESRLGPANPMAIRYLGWLIHALLDAHRISEADALCRKWIESVRLPDGKLPEACHELTEFQAKVLAAKQSVPKQ